MHYNRLYVLYRRFIAKNFEWPVRMAVRLSLYINKYNKNAPLMILTMGKVGSSSIYYTLKNSVKSKIYHLHYLSLSGISAAKVRNMNSHRKSLPLHVMVSEEIRNIFDMDKKYDVITLVREPIIRQISAFFQNANMYGQEVEKNDMSVDYKASMDIISDCVSVNGQAERKWFDEEIKGLLGIDVFKEGFDVGVGYKIYEGNNGSRLLVIRVEDVDKVFAKAISRYLGIDNIMLKRYNVGEMKMYKKTYEKVKNDFALNEDDLHELFESTYFSCFYPDFKEKIKADWFKD